MLKLKGYDTMGNNAGQMMEVREWLQGGFFSYEKKGDALFESFSMGGRMQLEDEDEGLGCLPLEEVNELLRNCAHELGIKYE